MTDVKDRATRTAIVAWAIIGVSIVVIAVLWVLKLVLSALVPFVLAFLIVLAMRSPVLGLERRGMSRTLATAVCYLGGLIVLGIFGAVVVPVVVDQIIALTHNLPRYYSSVNDWWLGLEGQARTMVVPEWLVTAVDDLTQSIITQSGKWGSQLAAGLLSAGGAAAGFLIDVIFALVIGFWVLKDMPAMRAELMAFFSDRRRVEAEVVLETVLRVLGGYLRGQVIVSLVTGLIAAAGLSILGVPYALVLGLLIGVLNVIPYVGPLIGGLVATIVAAFEGPWFAVGAIAVTIAAQQTTDLFVTPRVMSKQVDLHPILVIFSLLVGGTLFGFWGLVLAIPIAAIGKGLFVYYYERHTDRTLGSEDGALFRTTQRSDDVGAGRPCEDPDPSPKPPESIPEEHS